MNRRASSILTVAGLLGATLTAGLAVPASASAKTTVKEYSYGKHSRQQLDVYTPAGVTGTRPTVVLVHGGSWVKGDKEQMETPAKEFVKLGYVVVSVNYRYATQAAWPAQREDVQDAIDWVRDRADKLHVKTSRIVVLGSSAGAEIGAAAITEGTGTKRARGFVGLSGPYDLALASKDSSGLYHSVADLLMGCSPKQCATKYRTSSAIHRVSDDDPAMLLFASKKEWVNPQSSVRLYNEAKDHGLKTKLVMLSGDEHGLKTFDQAWPSIKKWVVDLMK